VLTSELDYDLPDAAIARRGVEPRDAARLLVALGPAVEHRRVVDLPGLLGPGDVVVVNDTRVLPARVRFRRPTGGAGEVLLLDEGEDGWWEALVRPSAKLPPGSHVEIGADLAIEIGEDLGEGRRRVRPSASAAGLLAALDRHGEMPLPPYLGDVHLDDPDRYQTVFARRPASAAAPTAGLHLTPAVLAGIESAGATVERIELVVGLGTFRPITVDRVEDHPMHAERYRIDPATWARIGAAERVVAVGTTCVRALESAAVGGALAGATDQFIRVPFRWRVVDVLMTNFHLPRSSLLAMVHAFVGPRWRDLYAEALAEGYRFLSFGDAMLLARDAPTASSAATAAGSVP
jgi:S-adenosylmethionine:tRNA ribosyltransferase-isomerase